MHEDLARLERLDTIDRDIASRNTEIDKLTARLRDAEAAAVTAKDVLEAASTAVEANQSSQKANSRKTREFQQRMASAIKIMEMGTGDPDAAERQRSNCAALIDDAETEMLELLEQADEVEEAKTAAETALAEATAAVEAARTEVPERIGVLKAEISGLTEQRAPVLAELPSDISSRYEHWRSRNKWAVARIERNACKACRIEIRPQHLTDLRKGRMVPCHGCHRWLVPDMELA